MNNENTDSLASKIYVDKKKFTCDICRKFFLTKIHYQVHLVTHLLPKHFNCHECQKGFTQILSLDKHIETHNNAMSIICHVCKEEIFDVDSLNQHAKKHNGESTNALIVQQVTGNEKTPARIHNNGGGSCHHESSEKHALRKHVSSDKLQNVFKCDTCEKEFSEKHHLDEHHQKHCIKIQLNSHKYEEVEPVSFTIIDHFHVSEDDDEPLVSDALYVNKNDILSENPQICENVKSFTAKSEETQNKSTNLCSQNPQTKEKFICKVCKKEFENKHSLTIHFSTHSEEGTFDCHLCEKKFSFRSLLNAHLRAHQIIGNKGKGIKKVNQEIKKFSHGSTNVQQITNEDTQTKIINSGKHNSCHSERSVLGKLVSNDKLQNIFRCHKCKKKFPEKQQLHEHHQNHCIQDELNSENSEALVPLIFTSVDNFPASNDTYSKPLVSDVMDLAEKVISSENSEKYENVKSFTTKSKESQNKNTNLCSQNLQAIEKFICEVRKKVFENKHSLTNHFSSHSEKKTFGCHLCEKKFSFKSLLTNHLRTHEAKKFSCGVCQKSFVSKDNLFNHVHIHAIVKSFKCNYCPMSFIEKSLLEEHRLLSHSSKECDICHKKLSSRRRLLVHQRIHFGPYVCKICSKSYTKWANFNRHKLIHTIPPKQPVVKSCSLCPEGNMLKSSGNSRLCIHLEKKPFKCDICEKTFATRQYLKCHRYTHSGQTPYVCEICKKGFLQKAHLILHHRSHTGEKPFLCETCGKKFRTKTGLQIHPCTLQNQAPFKCDVCQKGFGYKSSLDGHARIHSGEKPFVCGVCDQKFTQKPNLKRHLRVMHGNDSASVM